MEVESTPITQDRSSNNIYSDTRFAFCCFAPRRSSWWERVRSTSFSPRSHESNFTGGDRWWTRGIRAFKKIREWSEIVAGPKWKTFIRSFNRSGKRIPNYQYDALSYALNFDEGQNGDSQHDGYRNFSTRYAGASVKTVSTERGNDVAGLV
ncbi:hypothetical protein Lal_00024067 [Lupinus albus]|uniref:Uncharacterized protein n=1 Tax=Lupinus albus TaxID=3870 RepID=A0A6A5NWW2_LUPAL|nr:hypothetical protein Lalb_Chr13g0297891 [Lupinus albus]KAF1888055.1 hypothetical protein Lal_00024067 [Lupinus albus]